MAKMDPVVHFEMPAQERKRMAAFYKKTFGWKMEHMGADMGDYTLATTTETSRTGRPRTPGTINGGFFPKDPRMPSQHPNIVISVKDIDKSIQKVTSAGGEVLGKPMEIPGVGKFVSFFDTEGNRVGMMQPEMKAKKKTKAKKATKKAKKKVAKTKTKTKRRR